MNVIQRLIYLKKLHFNLFKTLYFNFKVFDFKQALKLPVFIYGRCQFEELKRGCIVLKQPKTGCVKIGGGWYTNMFGFSNRYVSFLRIKGKLILGHNIIIQQGILISVNENAFLKIGNYVRINERTSIHARVGITIEDKCRIGWNTQIFDTSFHYMVNNGKITYRDAPVYLEHNVWLANNVSIMKGSYLPAFTVVASNSLVNKNMMEIGEHCLIGGIPSKLIHRGVERLLVVDAEVDKLFASPNDVLLWEDVKGEMSKEIYQNW